MEPSPFAPTISSSLAEPGNISIYSSNLEPDEILSTVRAQASDYDFSVLEVTGKDFELLDFYELLSHDLLLVDDYDPEDFVQDRTMRRLLEEDGSYGVANNLHNVVTITYGGFGEAFSDNRFRFHHFSREVSLQDKLKSFLEELYGDTL